MNEQQDRAYAELILFLDTASKELGGLKNVLDGIEEWVYVRTGKEIEIKPLRGYRKRK